MGTVLPKVAIVYLSYHSDPHLPDAVLAWKNLTYPRDRVTCVIVDNPHPTYGPSVRAIEELVLPLSGREIPEVVVLPQTNNLGFAGGNNVGIRWAMEHGYDYIFLHNDDGYMSAHCLEPLVGACERDEKIALCQALIVLSPDTDRINSSGNCYQYLGFGFCGDYRKLVSELHDAPVKDISYASGAGLLIRATTVSTIGMLDEDLFLYHEDLEYSFRARLRGYRVVTVRDAIFYHKYQFGRSVEKFYWMERNRFAVLLLYFRWATLVLLLPMLIVLELGLIAFALRNGSFKTRLAVYRYWWSREHIALWLAKRRQIQATRTISDRILLVNASPTIEFQEAAVTSPILTYIGNPVMRVYYWLIVRGLIWW